MLRFNVVLLFVLSQFIGNAKKYYVGFDGNNANSGTSEDAPWATLSKVNSFDFEKHDSIFFRRGDKFFGELIVRQDYLYFGAYGKGSDPIISGFTNVTSWTDLGNNIWESLGPVSNLNNCNMVSINGTNSPMGRYPNSGYLTIDAHEANRSLSHIGLRGDWKGAELVLRIVRYGIDRNRIISQIGDVLNYTTIDNGGATPINGWGFFIQDSPLTLDSANEWFYNPINKKIRIYSRTKPKRVYVASVDTLVFINQRAYITFDGIGFVGANKISVKAYASDYVTIKNCVINFSGLSGIDIGSSASFSKSKRCDIDNCIINNSNDVGIINNNIDSITITNNLVKNSGAYPGMGSTYLISPITHLQTIGVREGIRSVGDDAVIKNNEVDSSGYSGIYFNGSGVKVIDNYINTYCFIMDDGGGIYSYSDEPKRIWKTRIIQYNIVENGIGAPDGTILRPGYNRQVDGIYLDAYNSNFKVSRNTVINNNHGLGSGGNHEVIIDGNTFVNNEFGLGISNSNPEIPMTNYSFINNIVYAEKTKNPLLRGSQLWIYLQTLPDSIFPKTFKFAYTNFNNNCYATSTNDSSLIEVVHDYKGTLYSLSGWKKLSGQDTNSHREPADIQTRGAVLYYNPNKSDRTIFLNGTKIDAYGNLYHTSFNLPPYHSKLLWQYK